MAFPQDNQGQYLAQNIIIDVDEIGKKEEGKIDSKELLVRLSQSINNSSIAINSKTAGQFLLTEFVNNEVYFKGTSTTQGLGGPEQLRPVFRKVINFGALPAGLKSVAHGLTIGSTWSFTHIYGSASNTTTNKYYPIPASNLLLTVDGTKVNVTNNTGFPFTVCMVVLEYLKQ